MTSSVMSIWAWVTASFMGIGDVELEGAERQRVEQHAQAPGLAALLEEVGHLAGDLGALVGVGGVDVEEHRLAAERLDLAGDPLDVGHGRLAVQVHAEDVEPGARQCQARRFAESRRRAERERPAIQFDHVASNSHASTPAF
jgi:hypothetical protein